MSEVWLVPSQHYSRGHEHSPYDTTSLVPKGAIYLSTIECLEEASAASCSGGRLLQSDWWPQWSCSDCPWHPAPSPVPGQALKFEHMALTPLEYQDFFSLMLLTQELWLSRTQSQYFKILLHIILNKWIQSNVSITLVISTMHRGKVSSSRAQQASKTTFVPLFSKQHADFYELVLTYFPEWDLNLDCFQSGWNLSQLFLINHHTCYLNVDYTYTNL